MIATMRLHVKPHRWVLVAGLTAVAGASATAQRVPSRLPADDGWVDKAPHKAGFITVQRGVRIHYLDFGGSGPPILLVPGIGNTAHAYDDFAPGLTDRFHVYAMTRRGFGESSHPAKGYDIPRLTLDIRTVMDSLHLAVVDLIGHSFAGQELTHFARAYPSRLHKLVYLDGAYDTNALDSASQSVFTSPMPYPTKAPLTDADTSTYRAYVKYVHTSRGVNIPESDIRVRVKYDGIVEELGVGYSGIGREADVEPQEWETLKQPALAIFAVRDSARQSEPWIVADTASWPDVQAVLDKSRLVNEFAVADFKRAPHGEVLVVHGGHHWVFVSHREEVLRAVRAFLLKP
jgi:pimeloyl-ACP methyl ester carboxylesterase